MYTFKNCSAVNCGSVFGLGADIDLDIDGLYVQNCGTVYNIDSEKLNINVNDKNLYVENTNTYIRVGNPIQTSFKSLDNSQSIMRIAQQYIAVTKN